jgi:hypothetical protein
MSSVETLHVTNGDSVLYTFKKAGITGTHIGWDDVLNEGPVPGGLDLEQTTAIRARYLSERYGNAIKTIHSLQKRDATLRRAPEFGEIVLWFEHDLYDQLQILQILVTLDEMNLEPGRVSTIQSDAYLGPMTVDELSPLLPKRRTATAAIFKSARRSWARFTSADPGELFAAAQEDAIGLPFLRAGIQRLCQEYPWTGDGLSRGQRHALEAVAQGVGTKAELFRRAQNREEATFQGDSGFYAVLDDLRDSAAPLIEGEEGAYVLSALGRRVIAGDADWLEHVPADRWIGGVHLEGANPPRWDDDNGRFA